MKNQNQLIQLLNINKGEELVFLIGAGCSISSGCMAANKLVYEFKKRIYCADKSIRVNDNQMVDEIKLRSNIDSYFDDSNISNQYSYYFNKCFPDSLDRNNYIKMQFQSKKPSLGYLCFANYIIEKGVKYVLTTNFDLLLESALHKINDAFDFSVLSENQQPIISSSFNLVKLHGDYKYDAIRNLEDEVKEIEANLKEKLLKISASKIIVIGYSGADDSVINYLNEYLEANKSTQLIWCGIEETLRNERVTKLLEKGRDSYYQLINGFDPLFENYYNTFGKKNTVIEEISSQIANDNFSLNVYNQPEQFTTNAYEILQMPIVYRLLVDETCENKLQSLASIFKTRYKQYFYVICDKKILKDNQSLIFEEIDLASENVPLRIKCKLLKEFIKQSAVSNGFLLCRDNIYKDNNEDIKIGLKINVELLDSKICLLLMVNYFATEEIIDDSIKYQINRKKSDLYTRKNYDALQSLIKTIMPHDGVFTLGEACLSIKQNAIVSKELLKDYDCSKEPIMVGKNMESTNQLKILYTNGPKEVLFSRDVIKVGIFCCEEDKQTLKYFLSKLINGDNGYGRGIIQQFKGFENIFHKKIEFLYDALLPFQSRVLLTKSMKEIVGFYNRGLNILFNDKQVDLALIYFSDKMSSIKEKDGIDFHAAIKLTSANKYKTQFLEEKTIVSKDNLSKILYNLSTAIYTKTIGMPWYPKRYQRDTLFLGMSFGCDSKGITVGCSQMFDGAGRGMQLIISQVSDKKRKNQYLNKEEAFELGKKIRQTYYRTSKIDELKRIVIHRADPFMKEEIEGFRLAFEGIDDFDLIQLAEGSRFNVYPIASDLKCGSYPIKRGTIIKASKDVAYIWTDGSVNDNDVLPNGTYRNNPRGMSSPLKIVKHYGKISINDAADDLLMLSKMDFNSADVLYSKLPVTIKYSRMVCDLIKQDNFADDLISFEYIM